MDKQSIWGSLDPFYESGAILGRRVANTGFLDALLKEDPFDEYHFFPGAMKACKQLASTISARFPLYLEKGKVRIFDRRELPRQISQTAYHCFHQSDCIMLPPHLASVRNLYSRNLFPITSTTHSLSYSSYGQSFLGHIWGGTSERDCIVSTSRPGVEVVENFFKFLRRGYALDENQYPSPQVRRIPLGVNTETLKAPDEKESNEASMRLGLEDGDKKRVNLLVFGRISHFSKMDILPLFRALQKCFRSGTDKDEIRLILAGWLDKDDEFHLTLEELARNAGIKLSVFARPSEKTKQDLYRAADIFVSIADNPQETFGLTVLEAQAMGLPVVASDYDGYRDLVEHETTGFLVPTVGPARTSTIDAMSPLVYDNHYHLQLAQLTAVETPELALALQKLIKSNKLRQKMGKAGLERVREKYSWKRVINDHVKLWKELNLTPVDEKRLRKHTHPEHIPYAEVFGHYPTRKISPSLKVATGESGHAVYRKQDFPLIYKGMERTIDHELIRKITFFARKPLSVRDLSERIHSVAPDMPAEEIESNILWCLKHDILEMVQ